jgi:uncharacterized YccA/Bax inhibitor family protein
MESRNPVLQSNFYSKAKSDHVSDQVMTVQGTVNKSFFLLFLLVSAAYATWFGVLDLLLYVGIDIVGGEYPVDDINILYWFVPAVLINLILALVICYSPRSAKLLAPVYAVVEGIVLGILTMGFEKAYPGIAYQAVLITFGVFLTLLMAYKVGLVRATQRFKVVVSSATMGVALIYLIDLGLKVFMNSGGIGLLHEATLLGIGASVVISIIAALNLVLDFDFIESSAKQGAPKYLEWFSAFALLVTLIWLYLEILNLLSKTKRKSD